MTAVPKIAWKPVWRPALIAASVLILSACSSVTLFYTFADTAIEHQITHYLDVDDDERAEIGDKVDALMRWHRTEMLPRYARFLRAQAAIVESGEVTRETVTTSYEQVRELMNATLQGAYAPAASILVHHTGPAKLAYLRRRMTEAMEDRAERAKRPRADRIERRTHRFVENIERFTGPLSDAQVALIRRHAEATDDETSLWINYRIRREDAFLKFLATRPNEAEIAAFLEKVLLHAEKVVGPRYRTELDRSEKRFQDLIYRIAAISTPKQRRTTARHLREFADDFTWLSKHML